MKGASVTAGDILLVDDEPLALKYFTKALGHRFRIHAVESVDQALKVLETQGGEIAVIVTDQRMPDTTGIELLRIVRDRFPHTVRVLTTAYTDIDLLVTAINAGAVYAFVAKPWEVPELEKTLLSALEHHESQNARSRRCKARLHDLQLTIATDHAQTVGATAAKLGHYVYNAMYPLSILIGMLIDRADNPSKPPVEYPADFLQRIRANIDEVVQTLTNLERMTHAPHASDFESLDIEALYEKAFAGTEVVRKNKRLDIIKGRMTGLPPIRGVSAAVESLFRFMIAEEAVSLPNGSSVRVDCTPRMAGGEVVGVEIAFEDSVPLPPSIQADSLLQPFNLRGPDPREYGIFLVSCFYIASHHGGTLTAMASSDGVRYSIFLPCVPTGTSAADTDEPIDLL